MKNRINVDFWSNSKVLITGANGFAGSSLCKQLVEHDAKISALVRDDSNLINLKEILPKINLVYGDVRYPEIIDSIVKGKDYVFHLAAKVNIEETRNNPSETIRTNINGTFNVANSCLKYGIKKLVHVSTCHVYGDVIDSELPIKEDVIPHPNDVYSSSKHAAEFFVRNINNMGLETVMTRAFNHYGPGQTGNFFIPKVIKQLQQNVQPMLGNSKPTRDYCYVDDITKGYLLAAEKGKSGEIYHFASGIEISMGELYEKIRNAHSSKLEPIWSSERTQDMNRSCGNYDKAKSELGWKPEIELDVGIRKTVEWWKNHEELFSS